jgi:hypothetical protein
MTETEFPSWSRLPVDLQHQYFEHARAEYLKCKRILLEQAKKLMEYKKLLEFKPLPEGDAWKSWRIAAVDGSYSPKLSERVGARFGVYQAGCLVFNGDELSDERYISGERVEEQRGDPELTNYVVRLLCTKLERETALSCLEKDKADLVLVDGALFGFRIGLSRRGVRSHEIDVEGFRTVENLADYVLDRTIELLRSGKVFGVIKRVRTAALDGYVLYRFRSQEKCLGANDKAILASMMPSGSWFAYEWLPGFSLGDFVSFNLLMEACRRQQGTPDSVLKNVQGSRAAAIKEALKCDLSDIQTSRYYVRAFAEAPPFCIEAKPGIDLTNVLEYFSANCNRATGLPFPIDLVDENISVPEGFTREFMEEVEANLIRDEEMKGIDLSSYFTSINPQKEE